MKTISFSLYALLLTSLMACNGISQSVNEFLSAYKIDEGIQAYQERTRKSNPSDEDLFSLGTLQFIKGIENLTQNLYHYGLTGDLARRVGLPFLRLPVPTNPEPDIATYPALTKVFSQFQSDVLDANGTLNRIQGGPFKVAIDISKIRLDINRDGNYEDSESFHRIYTLYNRRAESLFEPGNPFIIHFDTGDAYWLKGYTHLLMAMTDVVLAYDWSRVHALAAHVFFSRVGTELERELGNNSSGKPFSTWVDLIGGIHGMNMEVLEPNRLVKAHHHLLETIRCSHRSWDLIEAENDNDREWIPNSNQSSVNGVRIPQEWIGGWKRVLDEFETILNGEKLVPHWRFKDGRGINVKRLFTEPRSFDLLFWIQGPAALPYLEEGPISSSETWSNLIQIFRGQFIGFAIWIN